MTDRRWQRATKTEDDLLTSLTSPHVRWQLTTEYRLMEWSCRTGNVRFQDCNWPDSVDFCGAASQEPSVHRFRCQRSRDGSRDPNRPLPP